MKTKKTKSQVSMEYLLLVGFVFVITIPLLVLYYSYSTEANYKIVANQLDQIAKQLVDAVDAVYYLGEPSKTTLKVYMPANIDDALINGKTIIFRISHKGQKSDIVAVAASNMNGNLPKTQGIHFVTVIASTNAVNITTN